MNRCKTEIDILHEEIENHIWTFRWIWILNIAGFVWGLVARHYDLAAIAGGSALIALVGIGRTRRGLRLLGRIISACLSNRNPKQ